MLYAVQEGFCLPPWIPGVASKDRPWGRQGRGMLPQRPLWTGRKLRSLEPSALGFTFAFLLIKLNSFSKCSGRRQGAIRLQLDRAALTHIKNELGSLKLTSFSFFYLFFQDKKQGKVNTSWHKLAFYSSGKSPAQINLGISVY